MVLDGANNEATGTPFVPEVHGSRWSAVLFQSYHNELLRSRSLLPCCQQNMNRLPLNTVEQPHLRAEDAHGHGVCTLDEDVISLESGGSLFRRFSRGLGRVLGLHLVTGVPSARNLTPLAV